MVSLRLKLSVTGRVNSHSTVKWFHVCRTDPALQFGTCESPQLHTASHVVIEEDPSTFVVALDDCIESLRTDAVT